MTVKTSIRIPYGSKTIAIDIAPDNLIGIYSPHESQPVTDIHAEILRAISCPIATKPLRELATGAKKVVLVADDNTRLTPTDRIIPVLLNELNAAGVADAQISLIIALGTHRFMTAEEIVIKYGKEAVSRITIKNHDYRDPAGMRDLGTTPNGTHIFVNKEVYEADFKLGIGSIVPHYIPGFAGGAKIVQPGISGERTTAETHLLSTRSAQSYLGIRDNPVRIELNSIARTVGLHTIINTVLNRQGEVVGAFYGDTVEAFNAGVELARQIYSVEVPEAADIVIASSHPCDLEFWQAHKALYPSDLAVKPGGIIILATPCYEGVSVTHAAILAVTNLPKAELMDMVEKKQIADEVAASLAIGWSQVKERESVFIVSDGVSAEDALKLGFVPFGSVEAALEAAFARKGGSARVTVLTHAPDMIPVVEEQ
jgi:nickel-dependent lactate racemase